MLSIAAWFACFTCVLGSVLVPTYVLPPASFWPPRGQRSPQPAARTLARLAGGHLRLPPLSPQQNPQDADKSVPDHAKNSFISQEKDKIYDDKYFEEEQRYQRQNEIKNYDEKVVNDEKDWVIPQKDLKNYEDKFAGVVVKVEGQNVGWNQGQWDDGMLMSSAGNGKEKKKTATADADDEDKKTLADQVAEGKYGLIQKELFVKPPVRPGVISYKSNPETESKDNRDSLGGLKDEEIWLADDQLLVLKGGSFPDHGVAQSNGGAWPPIDAYQAPPRQVKIPHNPKVPPPFPVRLAEGGPLVFLTPNGSVPASLFPAFPEDPSLGPAGAPPRPGAPGQGQGPPGRPYPGDFASGGTPFPIPPFALLPRNESQGFPPPQGFPLGFPPGFGPPNGPINPPPANLSDLYDEDDPSIYYPPPYSFSYKQDNASKQSAGPLVPGIVLPPPPDFFAQLEDTPSPKPVITTTTTAAPQRRPSTYLPAALPDSPDNAINDNTISTVTPKTVTITSRPIHRIPAERIVAHPKPIPPRKHHVYTTSTAPAPIVPTQAKLVEKKPAITVLHKQPIKTTLKPVIGLYDYPEKNYYEGNSVGASPQPFLIYGPPEGIRPKPQQQQQSDKTYVTSTPVPLRAYYNNPGYENVISQVQYTRQNPVAPANTRLRPDFFHNSRQNGKSVASFYFYEEPAKSVSTPAPATYFDGRNYYQTVNAASNGQNAQNEYYYSPQVQSGFAPTADIEFRPVPSRDPSPFFFVPQRQGSRTLTQEYFSVQKPKPQSSYIQAQQQQQVIQQQQQQIIPQQQPSRPSSFYDQIANIQQTIDYYTTRRPNIYQQNPYREVRQKPKSTPRPVYQFSFQNNNARPEQNTFRAPKMDNEPFRPMVSYSKPYNVEDDYISTPVYTPEQTTEAPQPAKYFTTIKPEDYDYEDASKTGKSTAQRASNKPLTVTQRPNPVTQTSVLKPVTHKYRGAGPTTKTPVNHAYYTKQEEGLFDDITKNYFTIFGQKIEQSNSDGVGIAVTAPIRPTEASSTIKTPINNAINIQYENEDQFRIPQQRQPVSLISDTDVNYKQPRPSIHPESEFIPIVNPEIQAKYNAEQEWRQQRLREELLGRQGNRNVEIIKSEGVEQEEVKEGHQFGADQLEYVRSGASLQGLGYHSAKAGRTQVAEGRPGSLIAYRLPGEGAHVYFLTPQPAKSGEALKYRTEREIEELS